VLQAGKSGQPNDCSFFKLGHPGKRIIVRSGCPARQAGSSGWNWQISAIVRSRLLPSCLEAAARLARRAQFRNNCSVFSPDAPVLPGH